MTETVKPRLRALAFHPLTPCLVFGFFTALWHFGLVVVDVDEAFYGAVLGNQPLWEFLAGQYARWSSRTVIEFFLCIFSSLPRWVWRAGAAVLALLLLAAFAAQRLAARRPLPRLFYAQAAVTLAGLGYMLACPGVKLRSAGEAASYYRDFAMQSFLSKAEAGISGALGELFLDRNLLYTLFFALLAAAVWQASRCLFYRLVCLAPLGVLLRHWRGRLPALADAVTAARGVGTVHVSNCNDPLAYLPFLLLCGGFALVCGCVYIALGHTSASFAALALLLAGFCTRAAIGFTPASAVSGERTGFLFAACVAGCGLLLGRLLAPATRSRENRLILTIALLLALTGVCTLLDVSPLLACMVFSAVYRNHTDDVEIYRELEGFTPPIMALFFIISGMNLQVNALGQAGLIGVVYFILRIVGKYGGAYGGSRMLGYSTPIQNNLGLALIPQAGVALGLAFLGRRILPPAEGELLFAVILSSSVLYELAGPPCAKLALLRSGAIPKQAACHCQAEAAQGHKQAARWPQQAAGEK